MSCERVRMPHENGSCPNCGGMGDVGVACGSSGCLRRSYHFIPHEHLDSVAHEHLDAMIGRTIDDYLVVSVLGAGGFGKP
jgi:hypothetical protein